MTVKFLLQYSTRPIQIFGRIGLIFGGVAMLMFGVALLDRLFMTYGVDGSYLIKRPFWVIAPLMFMAFCIQFIVMGLLAELQIRTYHESQGKPIYTIKEIVESPAS